MSDTDWTEGVDIDAPIVLIVADGTGSLVADVTRAGFEVQLAAAPEPAALEQAVVVVVDAGVDGSETLINHVIATPFGPRVIVAVSPEDPGVVTR